MAEKNPPIESFTVGSVQVTIWDNKRKTEKGERHYESITIKKRYPSLKEGKWMDSPVFFVSDLKDISDAVGKMQRFVDDRQKLFEE